MTHVPPPDLADLAHASAVMGVDPLLIQAAGGNTSVKDGEVLWIKASGTLLADAERRDIFVPVDLPAMRVALTAGEARADQPAEFIAGDATLRPSIETSLHAILDQRAVFHVHSVNTIARAIRADAEATLAQVLDGFRWAFVPYCKPGAELARQVQGRMTSDGLDVVVLGNHGLIVAADSVAAAQELLDRVERAVVLLPRSPKQPDMTALSTRADDDYAAAPADDPTHQLALDPAIVAMATGGSLYPDHVIFCGIGATALGTAETAGEAARRVTARGLPAPPFLIVPGAGCLLRRDASDGARALARCLADVLVRVPAGTPLVYLTEAENLALLNWDAEKYRQAMNAG